MIDVQLTDRARGLWVRQFHPAPQATVRLVCFPYAGGSASFYYSLSHVLSPAVQVLALQYPGRQDRRNEPGIEDLGDLADQVFDALGHTGGQPLAFFGHSMGATVAFEVARRLEQETSRALVSLFVSACRAPSRHRDDRVHLAGDDALIAELRRLSGTNEQILLDAEALEVILPSLRCDFTAIRNYRFRPGVPLTCPVTVLVGDTDPTTTLEEARSWQEHTTAVCDLHVLPGGHFYVTEQHAEVAGIVSRRLLPGT
jgi:surfactin synthase thioesterase subunit